MKDLDYYRKTMEAGVVRTVSPNDEMFNYARTRMPSDEATKGYYLDTGREVATGLIKLFMDSGIDPESIDFLDFAAGYGRITRWLVPVLKSVTVADLEQEMLDFHNREFGVKGFRSSLDPNETGGQQGQYDVVFVFSLFTHLPDSTWRKWLKSLASLVKPSGLLIFSAHSYEMFAQLNPAQYGDPKTWVDEFRFWETNETEGRLDTSVYGCNIVKESYVRRCIDEVGGLEFVRRFKKGEFDRYHDIYVARVIGH